MSIAIDFGDGLRVPLKTIIEHKGIPIFSRNPMNYNYSGNDRNHPGFVDICCVENKENASEYESQENNCVPIKAKNNRSQRKYVNKASILRMR